MNSIVLNCNCRLCSNIQPLYISFMSFVLKRHLWIGAQLAMDSILCTVNWSIYYLVPLTATPLRQYTTIKLTTLSIAE